MSPQRIDPADPGPRRPAFDDPADAPRSDDPALLARLRDAFEAADYTVEGVESLLGEQASSALHRDLLEPASIVLREREATDPAAAALAGLVRLFLLAEPVAPQELPARLLRELRLARELPDGRLAALVDVRPYAAGELDCWIASDLGGVQLRGRGPLRRDHVVGPGPASVRLAQAVPRRPVERALDLGVGAGVQSLHLLAHARYVVASDVSARALAFARFTLLLSAPALGVDPARFDERVSLRLGDMLDPVAGERFDLVVSNPPFVITPRRDGERPQERYGYRDGGRTGDRIVQELLQGLGGVLAPGGIACLLGNWEIRRGDGSWHERLASWPDPELDLWVVQREQASPVEYAETWLRDAAENAELDSWREAFADYLRDFAEREVERVGLGLIVARRPGPDDPPGPGEPLRRFEALGHRLGAPLGQAVQGMLERGAWLRARDDERLRAETLLVAPDVSEERHARPGDEHPSVILLRQGQAFRRTFPMSSELAGFVSVCDGELRVGQILTALAAVLDLEEDGLAEALLPEVRRLVADGFLLPARP